MSGSELAGHAGAAFGAAAGAAAGIAGLFVVLPTTHFFLDPGVLDELPETPHRIVDRLVLTQPKPDHSNLLDLWAN
jgi:hypothetical protein